MKKGGKSEYGFTFTELLISILVMGIAIGSIWCVFSVQINGWISVRNRVNALQAAIDGNDFMFNEITGCATTVTSSLGTKTNYLTFKATNIPSRMVRYYKYSPDKLRRKGNAMGNNLITNQIDSITFLATQIEETYGSPARIEIYQYVESEATVTWHSYSGNLLFYNIKTGITLRPH